MLIEIKTFTDEDEGTLPRYHVLDGVSEACMDVDDEGASYITIRGPDHQQNISLANDDVVRVLTDSGCVINEVTVLPGDDDEEMFEPHNGVYDDPADKSWTYTGHWSLGDDWGDDGFHHWPSTDHWEDDTATEEDEQGQWEMTETGLEALRAYDEAHEEAPEAEEASTSEWNDWHPSDFSGFGGRDLSPTSNTEDDLGDLTEVPSDVLIPSVFTEPMDDMGWDDIDTADLFYEAADEESAADEVVSAVSRWYEKTERGSLYVANELNIYEIPRTDRPGET